MFNIHLSKEYCLEIKDILYIVGDSLMEDEMELLYKVRIVDTTKYRNYSPQSKLEIDILHFASNYEIYKTTFLTFTINQYHGFKYLEQYSIENIHNLVMKEKLTYFNFNKFYTLSNHTVSTWINNINVPSQLEESLYKEFIKYLTIRKIIK